jgi:protein-disulfide isomerase
MVLVKRILVATVLLLLVFSTFLSNALAEEPPKAAAAAEVPPPPQNPKARKQVDATLPACVVPVTVTLSGMQHKLPANLVGTVVRFNSDADVCKGRIVSIVSTAGEHYLGIPWFLDKQASLGTPEAKLQDFLARAKTPVDVTVTRSRDRNGLYPVKLLQHFPGGLIPLSGAIDPDGTTFFIGRFFALDADIGAERLKDFAPVLENTPSRGAKNARVTIIEFSDFECPTCRQYSGIVDPILKKYPNEVRYVRYDLPLLMMHPWAVSAAVAGRAIYRQKPALFWEYKKQVYENQEKLTPDTMGAFGRAFAQDHDLDLRRYDDDVASKALQAEVLAGVGKAFDNDLRSTPTYLVNGRIVDPGGIGGKQLERYVAGLLGKGSF